MSYIPDSQQQEIDYLVDCVNAWEKYWKENKNAFKNNKSFAMISSIPSDTKDTMEKARLNQREFNVINAYVSRLVGEFSMQSPSSVVKTLDKDMISEETAEIVHSIIRNATSSSLSDSTDIEIYRDCLAGGYSAARIMTEYVSEDGFDQELKVTKIEDPTLAGFDPMAKKAHKGDGGYCYEIVKVEREKFKEMYPDIDFDSISRNTKGKNKGSGFEWVIHKDDVEYVAICDLFKKQVKKETLYLMGENSVITMDKVTGDVAEVEIQEDEILTKDEYDSLVKSIPEGFPTLPPQPKDKRTVEKVEIYRYRFTGSQLLEKKTKTDFKYLPIIFFDGDSVTIDGKQTIRPYHYNAKDAQITKNIIMNMIISELSRKRKTTMILAEESLPTDAKNQEAYQNPQKDYGVYMYKGLMWSDALRTYVPTPAPTPISQGQISPELIQMFSGLDATIQALLGSYDAQQGITPDNISGAAIIAGATQSNAAAKPYIINYIASYNQIYKIMIDMIPKTYVTNRTIPVLYADGSRGYEKINDKSNPNSILQYEPNCLDVLVEEGVSFAAQKNEAIKAMTMLSQTNQGLNAILSGKGLPILLKNLDIKGADELVSIAEENIREAEEAKAAMKGSQPPVNPMIELKAQELKIKQGDQELRKTQMLLDEKERERSDALEKIKLVQSEKELMLRESVKMAEILQDRIELEHEMRLSKNEDERQRIYQKMKQNDQAFEQFKHLLGEYKEMADKHEVENNYGLLGNNYNNQQFT